MKFEWNPSLYDSKHDFVFKFGEEIVRLLNPQKEDTILDLGCGTGDLTKKIADSCKKVIGLDNSKEMIQTAQAKYPEISFHHADARDYQLNQIFDAVFSNAVLHWIPESSIVIKNINKHLKIGGRFVAEFGGKGCNYRIISTLTNLLYENKIDHPKVEYSLFFPSIGQYTNILEQLGFEVNLAILFDRPTELKGGHDGLKNFIDMFLNWLFLNVSDFEKSRIIDLVYNRLESDMFNGTSWIADYRRIRIVAYKKNSI